MRDFRRIKAWEKAHRLTLDVYVATRRFPREELYGLTSQMRRSCASIPTNIAEGCGRSGKKEFCRFLDIASGSASELDYLLMLARDLNYLDADAMRRLETQVQEVKRMLTAFAQRLRDPDSHA